MPTLIEKLRQIEACGPGDPAPKCLCGDTQWVVLLQGIAKEAADALEQRPVVSVKPMSLSDGRTDYFVSIKVGDREVTPHVFRDEQWKAEHEAATYRWLLLGADEPDLLAYGPSGWPLPDARRVLQASSEDAMSCVADYTRNDVKKARDEIKAACPGALVEDWQDYGYKLTVTDTARGEAVIVMQPERPEIDQRAICATADAAIAWWRLNQ